MALRKLTAEQFKLLKQSYYKGVTAPKLAELFDISVGNVYKHLKDYPIRRRSKLTLEQIFDVLYSEGTLREKAHKFGVCHETIRNLIKRGIDQ